MSFRPEVLADSSGKWASNAVRFATYEEAKGYAIDLGMRWSAVREARVVECDRPVNYRWIDGRLSYIKKEEDGRG